MTHPGGQRYGGNCCGALTRLGDRCSKAASARSLEDALKYVSSAIEHVRRVREGQRPGPPRSSESVLDQPRPKARA